MENPHLTMAQILINNPDVTYFGYLKFKNSRKIFRLWIKCFLVILKGYLYVYSSNLSKKPKMIVILGVFYQIEIMKNRKKPPKCVFILRPNVNTISELKFAASSILEMNTCIDKFREGIINSKHLISIPRKTGKNKSFKNDSKYVKYDSLSRDSSVSLNFDSSNILNKDITNPLTLENPIYYDPNDDDIIIDFRERTNSLTSDINNVNYETLNENLDSNDSEVNIILNLDTDVYDIISEPIISNKTSTISSISYDHNEDFENSNKSKTSNTLFEIQELNTLIKFDNSSYNEEDNLDPLLFKEVGCVSNIQININNDNNNKTDEANSNPSIIEYDQVNDKTQSIYDENDESVYNEIPVEDLENIFLTGTSEEAYKTLTKIFHLGSYLVRKDGGRQILTVQCPNKVVKYILITDSLSGKIYIKDQNDKFESLPSLIAYYREHDIPNQKCTLSIPYKCRYF